MNKEMVTKRRLVLASLLTREVPNDHLAVEDELLQAVASGRKYLTAEQRRAVIRSPITLKRLKWLQLHAHSQQAEAAGEAGGGQESIAWLRAAAGVDPAFSLDTDDARYSIHFFPGRGDCYQVAVSCTEENARRLQRENLMIELSDSEGNMLLSGRLDELGELHGEWNLPDSPRRYLTRDGVSLVIREVRR